LGRGQIEHHDGDDDGDDAIGEGGQAVAFQWGLRGVWEGTMA
jgi:hypothetical protein